MHLLSKINNQTSTIFWIYLVMMIPVILIAQPRVSQVNPRQNEINVSIISPVEIRFSENINPATLHSTSWLVYGNQTGYYSGSISYDITSGTARFRPTSVFKEGETISVVLTSAILSNSGAGLSPFQSSFTVAVEFGTGVFDERIEVPLSQNPDNPVERDPVAIFAGDFNNDQFVDLAVANNTTNTVSVLTNQFLAFGQSFSFQFAYRVGKGPNSITGGDFDHNGWLDLAVSNFDDNSITILQNTGSGNFLQAQVLFTLEHPTQVEANDFNNDGQVDLAAVVLGVNRLQVFLNNGLGRFNGSGENYATGASPYGLTSGDYDNDGDVDIIVSNSGDNTIIVYKNDSQGRLLQSAEINTPDYPTNLKANDFIGRSLDEYGDGNIDLVLIHPNIHAISIFENRSRDGGFVFAQQLDSGMRPTGLFVADVDTVDATAFSSGFGKDHDLDVAVPNLFSNDVYVYANQFNSGFTSDTSDVYPAGETPSAITGADFDKDGDIDLAVTNLTSHKVTILLNKGGQTGGIRFTQPPDLIDFGQVYVGADSTRFFTLLNPTDESIAITNIAATLPVFTTSQTQATVNPGEIFAFSITFSPADTLVYEDSLVISSNAFGVVQDLTIGLRGAGIRAIIDVVPDTLNYAGILPPQTSTLPIEIFNRGNGALLISQLQLTDPAFTAAVAQLTVAPYSSQSLDITFTPAAPIAYLDTLLLVHNDSPNSPLPVILLSGPNLFPPAITSADTLFATEDIFASYTAAAIDSDGTQSRFIFRNLPRWLNLSSNDPLNASIEGTPREGDLDTSFTVIATDGLFSDTLSVYVRVRPVNDPPVIAGIAAQTVTELELLTFSVTAIDPEDSTLVLSALNLPQGAVFADNGNGRGTFSWLAPPDSRGVYAVSFIAAEVFDNPPLSDTMNVPITVLETLPDLLVSSLSIPSTEIAINQTRLITGVARAEFASVPALFRLTFRHNNTVVRDTVISALNYNEEISFRYNATFNSAGNHEIVFALDAGNQVRERDEDNNIAMLSLAVARPELVVRPNPFTPNADGYNDEAVFDFSELAVQTPELRIFNFNGVHLTTLNSNITPELRWNGRDAHGDEQNPGIYLYVLSDRKKQVATGYIVLAR